VVPVLLLIAALWSAAALVWRYRDRPQDLSRRLPLVRRYREGRPPLFSTRSDVMWFGFWPFLLGALLLITVVLRRA
jgi:hypothetical protein